MSPIAILRSLACEVLDRQAGHDGASFRVVDQRDTLLIMLNQVDRDAVALALRIPVSCIQPVR